MRWCPRNNCEGFVISKNKDDKKLSCQECFTLICFECRQEWHEGRDCDGELDENYAKLLKIKPCPQCK